MVRGTLQGIGHLPFDKDEYWEECCDVLGYAVLTKKEIYETLGYIPLPTMEEMHKDRSTHRIVVGGNRGGKTYGETWEAVPYLFQMGTHGWAVSANYDMASELMQKVIDILIERAGMERASRPDYLKPWQFAYGTKSHLLVMGTGSTLQLKSAESPNSMHAVPVDYILNDEAALLPYIIYDTRLVPRLVDSGGWLLNVGTLEWQSGEWFEEYFDIGQTENDLSIRSWSAPTEDNYHIYLAQGGETPEDVAAIYHTNWKQVMQGNENMEWPLKPGQQVIIWNVDLGWLKREKERIPKEIFAARYEAKRATSPYLVFPKYNIQTYVNKERAKFDPKLPVYLAIDPGGTYTVAAIQLKRFEDRLGNNLTNGLSVCIIDELYYQTTVTTSEAFNAAKQREWWGNVARWPWPHWDYRQGAIDATAKEQKRAWEQLAREDGDIRRLHLMTRKVEIQPGIQTMQHYLDTETIFVHPRCTFFNLEMRRYQYTPPPYSALETADPRRAENPKDAWNHIIKAVTYFLVNQFGYYRIKSEGASLSKERVREMRKEKEEVLSAVTSRFRR